MQEFLLGLTERLHAQHQDLRAKINGGDWSDQTQQESATGQRLRAGLGYALDEAGQPMDDDAPSRRAALARRTQLEDKEPQAA